MQGVVAGAYFSVVLCLTASTLGTGRWDTKSDTLPVWKVTFLIIRAVIVWLTANFCAGNVGVALQASGANTNALVSLGLALCPAATYGEWTGVNTFVWLASFVKWTVIISLALYWQKKKKKMNVCPKGANVLFNKKTILLTYIESIPDVDFLPSFRGICTLECGWMFCRWRFSHKGLSRMGQYSSFLCRPCHWYTRHHADILQFGL